MAKLDELLGGNIIIGSDIDRDKGAPVNVRLRVGAAHTEKDRLATLQKFYPDAQPFGDDNFIFTDPETGRPTLYNEEGWTPSLGDVASVGREISGGVGGALGGAGGAVAGGVGGLGVGAVPGAIVGAGLGTAGGEGAFDWVANQFLDVEDTRTAGERAADLAIAGATGMIGEGAGQALKPIGKAVFGKLAGAGDNFAAFERQGVEPTPAMLSPNPSVQKIESALEAAPFAQGRVLEAQTKASEQLAGATSRRAEQLAAIGAQGRQAAQAAEAAGGTAGPLTASRADRILTSGVTEPTRMAEEAAKKITGYSTKPLEEGAEAGTVFQRGAKDAAERYAAERNVLDTKLTGMIGADRKVGIKNVGEAWQALTDQLIKAPDVAPARVADARVELNKIIREAARGIGKNVDELPPDPKDWPPALLSEVLSKGRLPYSVLRNARTNTGTLLSAADASGMRATGKAEVNEAYHAMRRDILKAADETSPEAGKLQRELDQFTTEYRGGQATAIDEALERVTKAASPEEAWKQFRLLTKNATKFQRTLGQLKPYERDELGAALLDTLGKTKPGALEPFSPDIFLSNWDEVAKGTKDMLFSEARHGTLRRDLDDLAKISMRIKASGRFRNRSGTGNVGAWGGFLKNLMLAASGGGMTGLPVGGAVGAGVGSAGAMGLVGLHAGGSYGLGRLWSSPKFIRALAGVGRTMKPGESAAQLKARLLKQLAAQKWAGDPAEEWVRQQLGQLQSAPQQQP